MDSFIVNNVRYIADCPHCSTSFLIFIPTNTVQSGIFLFPLMSAFLQVLPSEKVVTVSIGCKASDRAVQVCCVNLKATLKAGGAGLA